MNIIAYRIPGYSPVIFEGAEGVPIDFGNLPKGFIVSPFDSRTEGKIFPYSKTLERIPEKSVMENSRTYDMPLFSKTEYDAYIKDIKDFIGERLDRKIVASRRRKIHLDTEYDSLFRKLCDRYPNAFIFFISTRDYGNWIGASPELLLRKQGNAITSVSLAGTRPAGTSGDWDMKNRREQEIVTLRIKDLFSRYGLRYTVGEPATVRAGNIEHLQTVIETQLKNDADLKSLLKDLSPTPALSGWPKDEAKRLIYRYEGSRELYGGYCGPVEDDGDFRLNVILRCASLHGNGEALLYAGGGITSDSDADSEWEETERKMKIFLDQI